MKLMIDIPDEDYRLAIHNDYSSIYGGGDAHIAEAIKNGIMLSDVDYNYYVGCIRGEFSCKHQGDCWGGNCEGCYEYVAHYEDIMALIQRIVKEIRPDADIN